MLTQSIRRVSFSPETTSSKPPLLPKTPGFRDRTHPVAGGVVSQLKAKLARALCFSCPAGITTSKNRRRSSRRVCSSSLARSRSYAEPIADTHRAEAVEDCIQFLNASSFSTFRRSASASSSKAW